MSETSYRVAYDRVEIVVGYVSVLPIEPIFIGAVRRHAIGASKTERVGHVFGGHRDFLEHDFILAPSQKFEIYYKLLKG